MPEPPMEGELPPMEGEMGGQPMQPQLQSTVQVDELLDNHQIELETCLAWLKSEIGLEAKNSNPPGWMNVRQHAEEHNFYLQQQQMAQQQAEMEQQNKDSQDKGQPNPQNKGEN
jgi:hypothetical protein